MGYDYLIYIYMWSMITIHDENQQNSHQKSSEIAEVRLLCDEDCSVPGQLTLSDFAWESKTCMRQPKM